MSLFVTELPLEERWNKEAVVDEIYDQIKETYPDAFMKRGKPFGEGEWDILVIRSVLRDVRIRLGNMGYERVEPRKVQQAFAIYVKAPGESLDKQSSDSYFLHMALVVDRPSAVMKRLKEEE